MKPGKIFFTLCAICITLSSVICKAQVKITDGAVITMDANSLLELESTNKGLLIPRMALNSVSLPAPLTAPVPAGMLVYSTGGSVTNGIYYWNGTAWNVVASGTISNYLPLGGGTLTGKLNTMMSSTTSAGLNLPHGAAPTTPVNGDLWTTTAGIYSRINGVTIGPLMSASSNPFIQNGNSFTALATLGTIDNYDLAFKTNNTEKMRIAANGDIGIGTATFDATNPEQLVVNAGTTTSVNAIYAKGTINNYFQTNIQNLSSGTQASSDVVTTANNGTETTNFMNMGINGGGYVYQSGNPIETGKANDCYLLAAGSDFLLVNNNAAKDMIFMTGGTATTNERMRISSAGIVTLTGKLNTVMSSTTSAGFNLPHGAAPTAPVNGDFWTTTAGIYSRINGVTIGPLTNASSNAFVQNGNSYAALATLGTNDNNALAIETNGTEKIRISTTGDVAIGSSTFDATNPEQLKVNAGTTTSYNLIKGTGSVNSYLQFNIKNNSNGNGASADVVATNDVGDESYGYIDMGINSSAYNQAAYSIGGFNDAYLYCIGSSTTGGNLAIGTGSNALIKFHTGGSTAANERMRIDPTGDVGIGITNPAYKLDVAGNVNINTPSAPSMLTMDAKNSTTNLAQIIFKNTSGIGDFQIAGDGGDIFWQGGGNRNLQMGAYHGMDLVGGRTVGTALAFLAGTNATYNTRILNTTNSIGLIVQGFSSQTGNLQEWRSSAGTVLSSVSSNGYLGIGTAPAAKLDVNGSFKLGAVCPVLTGIIKTSVSVTDNTAFDYTTSRTETLTVTGAAVNASVIVNPRTALPGTIGIASTRVSALNTVIIKIINSGASIALGTVVFDITVIQ